MQRLFLPLLLVLLSPFIVAACDGLSEPPGEYRVCCPDGETVAPGCPDDSCDDVGEAQSRLSIAASHVYTITSQNAPSSAANCNDPNANSWCECGTDYTNAAPRCNTASEVLMMRVPSLGCEVSTATLSYTVSTWSGAASVSVRRILRPVTDPTMGVAGLCASSAMASWHRSGPEAWSSPGASADGSDRTAASVGKSLAGNTGERVESFDVTALVGGSCVGGCVLAQYATGAHVQVYPGTVSLVYECAGSPAVCGDGAIEGAEACDDGDADGGDGCSAACALEVGFTCAGEPSTCGTICGDGVMAGSEGCDDGNTASADGCSAACVPEVCTCE